ncbi:MAG TPA: SDR family oxidoreductase [Tepidisphaeraceae bacterium]|nr:SDR family oxidoreductase [Tepidisphaeraceae bacterium]
MFNSDNGKPRVIVVTGASGGVGRAVVRQLGQQRAKIGLLARGRDALEGAKRDVEQAGGEGLVLPTDVSQFDQVEAAAKAVEERFGPIDVWINDAMVSMYSPFMQMKPEEFKHIVEVTFLGQVYGTRCALQRMVPRDRGVIIQVGSALAYRSIPLQSAYCASKHAIGGFTESVRSELIHMKSNVRISMVNLPGVNTTQFEWTKNNLPHKPRPTGPIFQPEVAADAICWTIDHDRRQVDVGWPTVEAVVGEKLIPGTLDHYLAHAAWEGAQLPEPADPNHKDNFWQPLPGDHGSHGPFDAQAKEHSTQLWATKHRTGLLFAAAGLVAAAGFAVARRNDNGWHS